MDPVDNNERVLDRVSKACLQRITLQLIRWTFNMHTLHATGRDHIISLS